MCYVLNYWTLKQVVSLAHLCAHLCPSLNIILIFGNTDLQSSRVMACLFSKVVWVKELIAKWNERLV